MDAEQNSCAASNFKINVKNLEDEKFKPLKDVLVNLRAQMQVTGKNGLNNVVQNLLKTEGQPVILRIQFVDGGDGTIRTMYMQTKYSFCGERYPQEINEPDHKHEPEIKPDKKPEKEKKSDKGVCCFSGGKKTPKKQPEVQAERKGMEDKKSEKKGKPEKEKTKRKNIEEKTDDSGKKTPKKSQSKKEKEKSKADKKMKTSEKSSDKKIKPPKQEKKKSPDREKSKKEKTGSKKEKTEGIKKDKPEEKSPTEKEKEVESTSSASSKSRVENQTKVETASSAISSKPSETDSFENSTSMKIDEKSLQTSLKDSDLPLQRMYKETNTLSCKCSRIDKEQEKKACICKRIKNKIAKSKSNETNKITKSKSNEKNKILKSKSSEMSNKTKGGSWSSRLKCLFQPCRAIFSGNLSSENHKLPNESYKSKTELKLSPTEYRRRMEYCNSLCKEGELAHKITGNEIGEICIRGRRFGAVYYDIQDLPKSKE